MDAREVERATAEVWAAEGGILPDHRQSVWKLSRLAARSPAFCDRLAEIGTAGHLDSLQRTLAIDLLTHGGSASAQRALRSVLESPVNLDDRRFPLLFQRLGLIASPDEATLDYLIERRDAPGPEGVEALLLTLGAAAGGAVRHGHPAGQPIIDELVAELARASDAQGQVVLLRALGNAGIDRTAPALLAYVGSDDPTVRRAVAASLRHMSRPEARTGLITLALDPVGAVQRRALRALGERPLTPTELGLMARAVEGGIYEDLSLELLAITIIRQGTDALPVLKSIIQRPGIEPSLKGRLHQLMGT